MSDIHTVYFIHHSHTDICFTHDQPIVWDLQTRFVDTALDLADKYADHDTDGAFRWTVETTSVLGRWLERASTRDIDRFTALERAGRIEVTGMFANLTPLYDTDQLIETFQVLRTLRQDYGFTIKHTMNCDVNGENWPIVDVLLDLGIEGFTMAINTHFGGALDPRPYPFYWEGPSGRKLATYNGWPYDKGLLFGIGRDADDFAERWWPRVQAYLERINYPLPILMIQSYHPFGDNGPAYEKFTPFIDEWNAAGRSPRIVMATPRTWWQAVAEHGDLLKTHRGDWTDYWNFGSISSAREQAINRASRTRLRSADALHAAVSALPPASFDDPTSGRQWTGASFAQYRQQAWEALHFWDEHSWGADLAIRNPDSEDTVVQWYHKANYAYTARSLSLLLQRDALADLTQYVEKPDDHDLLVFNPLPWKRQIAGHVSPAVPMQRGTPDDTTASRHFQDRYPGIGDLALPPVDVPGFGYVTLPRTALIDFEKKMTISEDAVVENDRYRITFDRERGGVMSLYDKQLDWEWVDQTAEYRFNGFVHEEVADRTHPLPRRLISDHNWNIEEAEIPRAWKSGWRANRTGADGVIAHRVQETPIGWYVEQELNAPGCVGVLTQRVFLPNYADYIECESTWNMGQDVHPEATYVLFPFNVPDAVARFDLGGQAIVPGEDQLPGVCRDYFTVQGWVDFSNGSRGVTVAVPENPMVQLGDFHFGHNQGTFQLERSLLLGWVTNNYWETNFRANQPGQVHARYRILPYDGPFDEAKAHRFGLEAANAQPVLQHLSEARVPGTPLPSSGSLLQLPEPPILPLHIKPAEDGSGLIVRLLNASDEVQAAEIGSGLFKINKAGRCDLLENRVEDLPAVDGLVSVELPPRRVTVVYLEASLA